MTCQECEIALGMDQNVDEHLANCANCRAFAHEMRANAIAFEAFSDDPVPSVRYRVMSRIRVRRMIRWSWALAAAAAIAIAALNWNVREETMPPVQIAHVPPPAIVQPVIKQVRKKASPPLMVKMLTPDPDVVIYWQIESEDGDR
jgi:hypothetical protein